MKTIACIAGLAITTIILATIKKIAEAADPDAWLSRAARRCAHGAGFARY